MLFGIIMLVLVAAIAFYHYIQGFFSSMISCVLVILAALIAVAYHEPVAEALLGKQLPAQSHAIVLVVMFSVTYAIMRLLADKLVPGNMRFMLLVDKIGAGVFGVLAGMFAVGVLVIAAQMLPFGPSIAGYSRMPLANRGVSIKNVPRKFYDTDISVFSELERDRYDSASASSMFPLPFDGMVLGLTSYLSAGGSLAGERSFAQVHPDYATELFGTRLAQPFGGGGVMYSAGGADEISVAQVYTSKSLLNNPGDIELPGVRGEHSVAVTAEGTIPVVVRVGFSGSKDAIVMTPAAVRLVVKGKDDSSDYYPVGSYQHGEQLLLTRADDPICVDPGKSVDFVFMVDSEKLIKADNSEMRLPKGSFVEANRAARVDLSNKEISQGVPGDSGSVGIQTKTQQPQ